MSKMSWNPQQWAKQLEIDQNTPQSLKNQVYFGLDYGYVFFKGLESILLIFEVSMVFWSF